MSGKAYANKKTLEERNKNEYYPTPKVLVVEDEEYNALNDCWEVISSAKQNGFNVDYDEDRWNKIAGLPNYH